MPEAQAFDCRSIMLLGGGGGGGGGGDWLAHSTLDKMGVELSSI